VVDVTRLSAICVLALAACTSAPSSWATPKGPYVVVLGSAQDAGLPQIGCNDAQCVAARNDPSQRRFASSLLLADPRSGRRWLIDAGPDLREQFELARSHPPARADVGPRPPLFDGIFLTHAHVGHYAGLMQLGREAYGAHDVPVFASARMNDFLAHNGPWSLLVDTHAIELRELAVDQTLKLADDLSVTALRVPHRDEFSDTLAFIVRGPRRALLYLPDIDKWERWDRKLEDVLGGVDVALVDGTFFADGEVAGRAMSEIPHPFMVETLERLRSAPLELRSRVVFTHMNHTNPAADPTSDAARRIRELGCRVARELDVIDL
jgi:pyrroloquinoline quinone biosynthesis protein B